MTNAFISSIWEFDNDDKHIIHDAIRWYGKLPQKLVRKLIPMYSKKGDSIMANFAGSGTVITEANIAERNAFGADIHPLSILTNNVKLNQYIPRNSDDFTSKLKNKYHPCSIKYFEDQDKWFRPESLACVSGILTEINKITHLKKRQFYTLALSKIIRDASLVDSRCINHIIVDKNKKSIDVVAEFIKSVHSLENAITEFKKITTDSIMSIKMMDARKLKIKNEQIDFMISHPPYANAVLYYNIYSIVSNILGYDYKEIRQHDLSSGGFQSYLENMKSVLQESYRVLKPNGYEALVVGDIRKNGNILTSFPYLVNAGRDIGFDLEDIFIWKLKQKAGMSVARRGNHIDHNYIMIFRKK